MSEHLVSLIWSLIVYAIAVGAVYGLFVLNHKNKKFLPVINQIAELLPVLVNATQFKGDSKDPVNKTFEVLLQIAEVSAYSVEQIYKSNGAMTSAEKLALAKENFSSIAKSVGLDPTVIEEKVIETLIETIVFSFDK